MQPVIAEERGAAHLSYSHNSGLPLLKPVALLDHQHDEVGDFYLNVVIEV
jgi:hypothetical protein